MLNPAELEQSDVQACVDALVDSQGGGTDETPPVRRRADERSGQVGIDGRVTRWERISNSTGEDLSAGRHYPWSESSVGAPGGLLLYDRGLAGREAFVAAGAQIATVTGRPLTLVDADALRDDTAALLRQLGVQNHVFLTPAEAAHWPRGFDPTGVLAIHGDALLDPAVAQPLRAAAQEASSRGHLVVARRPESIGLLDLYTVQTHRLTTDLTAAAQTEAGTSTLTFQEPGSPGVSSDIAPEGAQVTGVEVDSVTAAIGEALYPEAPVSGEPTAEPLIDRRREPEWGTGLSVAAAAARMTPESVSPPRWWIPNPLHERTEGWEEWTQSFMGAATPPPHVISEETVQRLQRIYSGLQSPQNRERLLSLHEQPDALSAPSETPADSPRLPAGSALPADRREHEQQRPPSNQDLDRDGAHPLPTGSPSAPPNPDASSDSFDRADTPGTPKTLGTYEMRQQTPGEREAALWKSTASKQRIIRELIPPAIMHDTGSTEADVISYEDLLAAIQAGADRIRARTDAWLEDAVRRGLQASRPPATDAGGHDPGSRQTQHDTVRQHTHGQEQDTAHQLPRHHPGR